MIFEKYSAMNADYVNKKIEIQSSVIYFESETRFIYNAGITSTDVSLSCRISLKI